MKRENLPIWRSWRSLLLQVEIAVKSVSRYNKYTLGIELRQSDLPCSCYLVPTLNGKGLNEECALSNYKRNAII